MTVNDFRKLALSFPEAIESAHMDHPDFRVRGKIFATLGYPDKDSGVVKLTPDEQRDFVGSDPNVFQPVKGAWGRRGSTSVNLPTAKPRPGGRSFQRRLAQYRAETTGGNSSAQ